MSVRLLPISFGYLDPFVALAFEGDTDLLQHYHVSPGSLDECVAHTLNAISETYNSFPATMKIYAVVYGNKIIGYTIFIESDPSKELYSFGINIQYRTKEVVTSWLTVVKEALGEKWFLVLWDKNTRAINFFERNGVEFHSKLKDKTILVCQQEG